MTSEANDSESIRSVARALLLLRTMNIEHESTLQHLQRETDLPKATVFRILRTLRQEGYVQTVGDGGHYRLTAKVRELGAGYTDRSAIVDVASPIALRLTRAIRWPLAIGTLDGDAIVVRYSTMPYSPLAVHATTLGQRLGLLDTAMGRVYLAFCEPAERMALLQLLRSASPDGAIGEERKLGDEFEVIRRQRYATRKPDARRSSATVAVPIKGDNIIATLCMTTFGRSLTDELIAQHVPVLQAAACEIAIAFTRQQKAAV